MGIASPPKLSPKTRLPTPSKDGGKARGAGLFGGAFLGAHSRMPGAGGSESARNCREAFRCCFRCRWRAVGSYTLFKGPDAQLLPISALTETRACDAERQGPRRFAWGAAAGAGAVVLVPALWCWCCGAGACAVVLVPALWCWCWCCLPRGVHSFRVPGLVVSRTQRKGIGAPALGTLPMPLRRLTNHGLCRFM